MQGQRPAGPTRGTAIRLLLSLGLIAAAFGPSARADDKDFVSQVIQAGGPVAADGPGKIQQVGCATCGSGLLGPGPMEGGGCGPGGCGGCGDGCGGPCYPGRYPCDCCGLPGGKCMQTLYGIYQCICCPDPCYEPRWIALANNAFWIDPARPVTQLKLGGEAGWRYQHPDRAELFWAAVNRRGPKPNGDANLPVNGVRPPVAVPDVDYQDGFLYMEGAVERFSLFVNLVYRHSDPIDPTFQDFSSFGDMSIGTKSLLLDCELIQVAFEFVTFIPTGTPSKGIGTGHVSLEPGLLAALKLTPESYLQGQLSYRFPLGGTEPVEGSMLHVGLAYNRLLWNCGHDIQLIGTLESNYYGVTDGAFTAFVPPSNATTTGPGGRPLKPGLVGGEADILYVGPGVRLVVCNKIDFGVAYAHAISSEHFARDMVRFEFRWRF